MILYAILRPGQKQDPLSALFSTEERAQTFLEERGLRDAEVLQAPVAGDYEYPAGVHAALEYDPDANAYLLTGLFAVRNEARSAAGDGGRVVTLRPDAKAVEDIH